MCALCDGCFMWIPELYTFLLQFRGCTGPELTAILELLSCTEGSLAAYMYIIVVYRRVFQSCCTHHLLYILYWAWVW